MMKSLLSPKHRLFHSNDHQQRTNFYVATPPIQETKSPTSTVQRRTRPPVPARTDSTRSLSSTNNSILSRSMETSSSSSSSIDHESSTNKSHSVYEHFVPLQSVREDDCSDEMNDKSSKMPYDQQRMLMETLKEKYTRTYGPKLNMSHHRAESIEKDPSNDTSRSAVSSSGFSRHERLRSSLPFIIKPAVKSNSLGLCFLICENETKKVLLPSYISCMDTLKALFVRAFPHQLTMKHMEMDHVRIYIREMERDIFYELEDLNDVKDRSVLKLVQFPSAKTNASFKETDIDDVTSSLELDDFSQPRISRFNHFSNQDETSPLITATTLSDHLARSLSEPRHRFTSPEPLSLSGKGVLSSFKSARSDEEDARIKMELMERQLEALTDLVKELTQSQQPKPNKLNQWIDTNTKTLYQQLKDLKMKAHSLRDDLSDIRRMQHSLQETFQNELEQANRKIEEQLMHFNEQSRSTRIEEELGFYTKTSSKINQDLEDLEMAVEQLQNDVKTKQCYITIHDVESFALMLSTISRTLVDLKTSFPGLREKLFTLDQPSVIKFLHEEPERLDYTIKKCKRLTAMLYHLKQLASTEEHRCPKPYQLRLKTSIIDRQSLLEEIQSISFNSDERLKAIEKAEKLRQRRLHYEHRLETLKQMKPTTEHHDPPLDHQSLTNSFNTLTSVCSSDSNHCPSPSLSYLVRRALTSAPSPTSKQESKIQVSSSSSSSNKSSSKVTFSQQLITSNKPSIDPSFTKKILLTNANKKIKPTPPPRIQSTSSSSAVSSASSSLSSCAGGGHSSRISNGFCGILPLLSPDRRHHGRCYSFSSSSTDTDSAVSNPPAPTPAPAPAAANTMRVSVTDL